MKKSLLLLLSLLINISVEAQDYSNPSVSKIASYGLPVLSVTTVDGAIPTCDIISAPEGELGVTIINDIKVPGKLVIIVGNDTLYNSGEFVDGESGMKIKIRGNTSAQWGKKPYKIKLQKKADLMLRGDDRYKDKEWILLCNYEPFNFIGREMNKMMDMQWVPEMQIVNLFLNDKYYGLYTLTESTKRNADCRLNVDKDNGYIFEHDPYWWNEDVYFKSDSGHPFTFKYPTSDEITDEQITYIKDCVNTMEQSITDGTYDKYIDVNSFASWILGQDILGNNDAAGSNMFMTKFDNTPDSKIMMGNLWDFNCISYTGNDNFAPVHNSYFYYKNLFNSPNELFKQTYKKLWNAKKTYVKEHLLTFIKDYGQAEFAATIDSLAKYEMCRYNYFDEDPTSVQTEYYYNYYAERLEKLDQMIDAIPVTEDGIATVEASTNDNANAMYNLLGQKLTGRRKGIYIKGGKKFLY